MDLRAKISQLFHEDRNLDFILRDILLLTLEDNKDLKNKVEDLQNEIKKGYKLAAEVSLLRKELKYYKDKDEANTQNLIELKAKILSLTQDNGSNVKNSGNASKKEEIKAPAKPKIHSITNKKIAPTPYEDYKTHEILYKSGNSYDFDMYFDASASHSICGPEHIRGQLEPPSGTFVFGDGVERECLGCRKITLVSGTDDDWRTDTILYVFNEVESIYLNRNDWLLLNGRDP